MRSVPLQENIYTWNIVHEYHNVQHNLYSENMYIDFMTGI